MDTDTLYAAAISGDADAIAQLAKQADQLNFDKETILHIESRKGNIEHVRFILREFASKNLLTKLSSEEHTALHLAAYGGYTQVAEILVDAATQLPLTSFQAFLRRGDRDKDTALHFAIKKANVDIVKLLVVADLSDPHSQNYEGKTPMYMAVEKGYNDIVEIISTTCKAPSLDGPDRSTAMRIKHLDQAKSPGGALYKIMDKDALYAAAIAKDDDAIAALEMQADKLNGDKQTILHTESEYGNIEHVLFILREFADKNLLVKLDRFKQTALHSAVLGRKKEVAEILIDAARHFLPPTSVNDNTDDNQVTSFQAFLRQADTDLDTVLHGAAYWGNASLVKLLVDADPSDTHTQNKDGKTPMYIAVGSRDYDIVKLICTTRTGPPNLDAPGGATVLHLAIKNLDKERKEGIDVIRTIIKVVQRANDLDSYHKSKWLVEFYNRTDENGCIILDLAVEGNHLDVVEMIVAQNPAYKFDLRYPYGHPDLIGIVPLIYGAMKKESNDMVNLLTGIYQNGVEILSRYSPRKLIMPKLISAIRSRNEEFAISLLDYSSQKLDEVRSLVTFVDNQGWTILHHAVYHEFDSVIEVIMEVKKYFRLGFVSENKMSPFYLAAQMGYTSTMICLMQSCPPTSSVYVDADENGQNILHIAALQSKKDMIQGILKYCRAELMNKFVNKKDSFGDTPLHLLIERGCFVPELLRYEVLDIKVQNNKGWTALDMLYFEDKIINDQVQVKIVLDGIQTDPSKDIFSSSVPPSKRMRKDKLFIEQAKQKMHEKYAQIKEDINAIADCFADAIAGDPISKDALMMKANTLNEWEETILHIETKKGVIENVQFIVSALAKKSLLGRLDRSKQTALHHAAHHGHTQVVKVLLNAARHLPSSANVDVHNPVSSFQNFIRQTNSPFGNTALHLAVLNGNVAIAKLLIEADPDDSHVQNIEGKTPIYIAVENRYTDIVKEMCKTCTALSLDGPCGQTTALHALIKNIGQVTEGANSMIKMMIDAAKDWSSAKDQSLGKFRELFSRTDESGSTVLQLAMERNYVDAAKLILPEDPTYQLGFVIKRNNIMHLIHKAIDKKYSQDIIEFLSETYEAGIDSDHKGVLALILDIRRRDEDSVLGRLRDAKKLVTFKEDNGWTPLHYAVHHEFDSILGAIIAAQEDVGHEFVYGNNVSTPFHVAVTHGYTSTLIRLMQSWPDPSSTVTAANSPYTAVNEIGRNILHLAAADNRKDMVQCILKYSPVEFKDRLLKQQDTYGNTPIHLLISHGCFIPELIKHEVLDTVPTNDDNFTPQDMLYYKNDVVADQLLIKIALEGPQTKQSAWNFYAKWNCFAKSVEKKTDIANGSIVHASTRRMKDVIFEERKNLLMDEKHEKMKKKLERYKMRTNTQIIVTALITTVTFTVGFTMPGGLYQSGQVDQGLVIFSRKKAFNAFMVSDALALALSTSSLFFYFLESMNQNPRQVKKLNATSTALNIISVMAMMLTFITGTYVVLSHSPILAIGVCVIGSLFFLLVIVLLIIIVCAPQEQ